MTKAKRQPSPRFVDHELISSIEDALTRRGMSATAFGRAISNDSMLLADLKDGREVRRSVRERIQAFISGANDSRPGSQARAS